MVYYTKMASYMQKIEQYNQPANGSVFWQTGLQNFNLVDFVLFPRWLLLVGILYKRSSHPCVYNVQFNHIQVHRDQVFDPTTDVYASECVGSKPREDLVHHEEKKEAGEVFSSNSRCRW